MKYIIYFLAAIILIGCNQTKKGSSTQSSQDSANKNIKSDDTLQSIIDANINKQPVIDTTFLGFAFSMTRNEALAHFNKLIKEGKLIMNEQDKRYEYPLTFDLIKANATIAPEFTDNKLYKLSLVITPADDMSTEETVYLQTTVAYMKKYRSYSLFQEPDLLEPKEKDFHWIKNNLHVYLHKTEGALIVSYINMPAEKVVNKKKSTTEDSTKAQTNKDI